MSASASTVLDELVSVRADCLRPGDRLVWQRGLTQRITAIEVCAGRVRVTFQRPMASRYNPEKTIRLQSHHSPDEMLFCAGPLAPRRVKKWWRR